MSAVAKEPRAWSAVGSMSMCAALLIASEFMPVSLLTPIASDLSATDGMAGQAISISGLFAVLASLLAPAVASRFERRHVLVGLTGLMLLVLGSLAVRSGTRLHDRYVPAPVPHEGRRPRAGS